MIQLYLLLAIVAVSSIKFGSCEIKDVHIVEDSRPIILFEKFGFAPDGHVDISTKHVSWKSKHQNAKLNLSSMGFFLVRDDCNPRILKEFSFIDGFSVLSSMYVQILLVRFDKIACDSAFSTSLAIDEPDEYIVFGNCRAEIHVSMKVHTEMYSIHDEGKDFLPADHTSLPKFYFIFFLVYAAILAMWGFICIKQRFAVHKIHLTMPARLLFKPLTMICAPEDKMHIRKTGTPHGWGMAFYIFGFLKGVTLFIVIILIGTGWSFLKPYREKGVLMFVIHCKF